MAETTTETTKKRVIAIPPAIVIKDLAALLELPVTTVIAELMKNGIMSSMNERIDYDTAAVIAEDLGFSAELKEESDEVRQKTIGEQLKDLLAQDIKEHVVTRPPVVVVMGHVDHGKTKLLDAIRKTNVVAGESGGITQHIGAYQVVVPPKGDKPNAQDGRAVTFIDTPGHEAFTAMRSRGAHVADIAILVVAADDGIKPQTKEAIAIIKQAGLPFLVAMNKVDKPEANVERVKQQLAQENLLTEDWGGKLVSVPVSALTGTGVDDLLETVLLLAEVNEDRMRADPSRNAVGTVVESHIDQGEGPVATVLVRTGTLRRGDTVNIGGVTGKIKALKDWRGIEMPEAGPSVPAKILGFKHAPEVGDILTVVLPDEAKRLRRTHRVVTERSRTKMVYQRKEQEGEGKKATKRLQLNIVLRSDNLGSQEAILETLQKYESSPVSVNVVAKGLGSITEADVLRADTAKALLVGFHVVPTQAALEVAKSKQVAIETHNVIYDLFEEVEKRVVALLPTEIIEKNLGRLSILAVFRKEKRSMIVGGRVTQGTLVNHANVRVLRGDTAVAEGTIAGLQLDKKPVTEVKEGKECGIRYEGEPVIEVGDVLEAYRREERRQTLADIQPSPKRGR